jgi:hypothetical protein
MQLHATGGNFITKSPFRLDPLTGQWCLNAFIDAPEVRALSFGPSCARRAAPSLPRRTRRTRPDLGLDRARPARS